MFELVFTCCMFFCMCAMQTTCKVQEAFSICLIQQTNPAIISNFLYTSETNPSKFNNQTQLQSLLFCPIEWTKTKATETPKLDAGPSSCQLPPLSKLLWQVVEGQVGQLGTSGSRYQIVALSSYVLKCSKPPPHVVQKRGMCQTLHPTECRCVWNVYFTFAALSRHNWFTRERVAHHINGSAL